MNDFDCQSFMASVRREAGERGGQLPGWRSLSALFRLNGNDFIVAAYRTLLKREADYTGMHGYATLADSLPGKLHIAVSLLCSSERLLLPTPMRRILEMCRKMKRIGRNRQ